MEIIILLKEISLLLGIWVAIYGIDSWRREHRGRRQIELAEESLALFYEAIDAIIYIRNPISSSTETKNIERAEGESEESYRARKDASVIYKRYNEHQELFNKIHSMRYRFMAQIGKEQARPFAALRDVVNEIFGAARVLSRLWARQHFRTDEQLEKHYKRIEQYEDIFWEGIEEKDPINPKLRKLIDEMEITCNGIISGKGTLYSLLNWKIIKKG